MDRLKSIALCCFIVITLCCVVYYVPTAGQIAGTNSQQQESEAQTMKTLLNEVHALRMALQKSNVNAYRSQITVERLRMQQEVVNALIKEQEDLQHEAKESERELPRIVQQIADYEKSLSLAADPVERSDRESEVKGLKFTLEREKQELQEFRDRDVQLTVRIQSERAKLNEINESLNTVEKELESQAAAAEKDSFKCAELRK